MKTLLHEILHTGQLLTKLQRTLLAGVVRENFKNLLNMLSKQLSLRSAVNRLGDELVEMNVVEVGFLLQGKRMHVSVHYTHLETGEADGDGKVEIFFVVVEKHLLQL